jgi:outer membrane protein OmpA-like peptidoglycan-associated protein
VCPPPARRLRPNLTEVAATDEPDDQASRPAPAALAAASARPETAPEATASRIGADLDAFKATSGPRPSDDESSALFADLSLEQRLHVQGLLADLNGTMDEQGLKMVVPGGVLFALDGEEIPDSAHDTLAKVAELIDMYDGREVRIVGHTDALGDSAYNKTLSARRAGLVKQFFVDRFDVEAARLATEGMGEARPIASNATLEGRRANRRVEVLILD